VPYQRHARRPAGWEPGRPPGAAAPRARAVAERAGDPPPPAPSRWSYQAVLPGPAEDSGLRRPPANSGRRWGPHQRGDQPGDGPPRPTKIDDARHYGRRENQPGHDVLREVRGDVTRGRTPSRAPRPSRPGRGRRDTKPQAGRDRPGPSPRDRTENEKSVLGLGRAPGSRDGSCTGGPRVRLPRSAG